MPAVAPLAASRPGRSLPKTRVGVSHRPRPSGHLAPPLHGAADCSWATPRFTTRPRPTDLKPYAYAADNPLNATDPSGLACLAFWDASQCSNPLTEAIKWANTPMNLPNPNLITGGANVVYGAKKISTVPELIVAGSLADLSIVGIPFGLAAYGAAGYQGVTGTLRVVRGVNQIREGAKHPWVCETPLSWGEEAFFNVVPGGGAIDAVGGLP